MGACIERCIGEGAWAVYLPIAYLALSVLNGMLRVRRAPASGAARVLAWIGAALDRISVHARHDGRGTMKIPGRASRP